MYWDKKEIKAIMSMTEEEFEELLVRMRRVEEAETNISAGKLINRVADLEDSMDRMGKVAEAMRDYILINEQEKE